MSETKEYRFTVFVERNEGAYVAHALEAGMVATADDVDDAINKIGKMLARHIEFAHKHGRHDEIYHPAAAEVWKRYSQHRTRMLDRRSRTLDIDTTGFVLKQNAYAATC